MKRFLTACGLSFTCSLIALQFGALWWVGLIIGFIAGYIGYDIGSLVTAVPIAFSHAAARMRRISDHQDRIRLTTRSVFYGFGAGASVGITAVGVLFMLACISVPPELYWPTVIYITARGAVIVGLLFALCACGYSTPGESERAIVKFKECIRICHPLMLCFWHIPRGIIQITCLIPAAIKSLSIFICMGAAATIDFIRFMYRYVHSDARLLFGIDVAIGVAAGYLSRNALLGGLAGGAWWLLDWHLISVRLMKLGSAK